MTDLDKEITAFYQSRTLDNSTLQMMIGEQSDRRRSRGWYKAVGMAVAACLMLLTVNAIYNRSELNAKTQLAQLEIALNHANKFRVDIQADSSDVLDAQMTELPFELSLPAALNSQWQLIGARYCSLNGNLAAHVQFLDEKTDEHYSVFVTQDSDEFEQLAGKSVTVENVQIDTWQERGYFYAMATPAGYTANSQEVIR